MKKVQVEIKNKLLNKLPYKTISNKQKSLRPSALLKTLATTVKTQPIKRTSRIRFRTRLRTNLFIKVYIAMNKIKSFRFLINSPITFKLKS